MRFCSYSFFVGILLSACHPATPPNPPPPDVTVLTVVPRNLQEQLDFVGAVQAFRTVQVRAQTTGVILKRLFSEGTTVRAGDPLYQIDPTIPAADWRSAKARLEQAQAHLANARMNVDRLVPLLPGHAVARQDVDNAQFEVIQVQAMVDDARGAVDAAKKALDETVVRAEISGRVGRALLDVGTRVTGSTDVLTTIDMLDPIYVSFQPSAQQQFSWRMDPRTRTAMTPGGSARVQVLLPDGTPFHSTGRISFVDPVVDPQTGTQQYRAQFANPDRLLVPGQFVHVHVLGLTRDNALLVPQRAVLQQMGRQVVYVVGRGDTVTAREVKTSDWSGGDWLIDQGVTPGDRIIVDGVQKAGPGRTVHPTPLMDSTTANHPAGPAR